MNREEFKTITDIVINSCERAKQSDVLISLLSLLNSETVTDKNVFKQLKFTQQEISNMPKTFKKEFRT